MNSYIVDTTVNIETKNIVVLVFDIAKQVDSMLGQESESTRRFVFNSIVSGYFVSDGDKLKRVDFVIRDATQALIDSGKNDRFVINVVHKAISNGYFHGIQ